MCEPADGDGQNPYTVLEWLTADTLEHIENAYAGRNLYSVQLFFTVLFDLVTARFYVKKTH
ncbi:MAG: hypothetical protein QXI37_04445 [Thermoprotei archaeon]